MKYAISSARYWRPETFVDEYARTILGAGFELERSEDGEFFYITLNSLEDLGKLSESVKSNIIFEPGGGLIIYDAYME